MKKITTSKILLAAVIGLGMIAILFGMRSHNAFARLGLPPPVIIAPTSPVVATGTPANGAESFTPLTVAPIATYDQSTQTVSLGGTVADGTETFVTQATCYGSVPGLYWVTGPLVPNTANWSIVDTSGMTVASGAATYVAATSTETVFGYVCGGTAQQEALSDYGIYTFDNSIDVSSLPVGDYTLKVDVSPECAPSYGYTSCSPEPADATGDAPFTVINSTSSSSTGSPAGTITVTSENMVDTSIPVNAEWDLTGYASSTSTVVCEAASGNILWQGTPCSGTYEAYMGVSANNIPYTVPSTATTTVPYYSLNAIERVPIAEKKKNNVIETLELSLNNIFSTAALADEIGAFSSGTFYPTPSQTLTPSTSSAAFTILWSPESNIQLSTKSISLDPTSQPSQTVTVTNDGAPGARLTWTASAATSDGGNWLIAPPGDTNPGVTQGSSGDVATISIDSSTTSTLASGTTGTVTFNWVDSNNSLNSGSSTVTVTLTVGSSSTSTSGGYVCDSDNYSCGWSSAGSASQSDCEAACMPLPPPLNPASTTPTSTGGYVCSNDSCQWNAFGGVSEADCEAVCESTSTGGYVCDSSNYSCGWSPTGSASQSDCEAACVPPPPQNPTLPACNDAPYCQAVCSPTLTANPSSIVVPESSKLSYSCSNVTECQLTQGNTLLQDIGGGSSEAVNSTYSVTPSITTLYTLNCVNNNFSDDWVSANTTVTVGGSSLCEQNPNGAGCPQ